MSEVPQNSKGGLQKQASSSQKSNFGSGPDKNPVLVAVDLGAESCRVSLLRWPNGKPAIQMVHRFANSPTGSGNGLRWDLGKICAGVEHGLRRCADLAPDGIAAVGVDGWAVDYVRLGKNGSPVGDPFCYRDERNLDAARQVHARISPDRLYALTGIQFLPLNTLYQLFADGLAGMDQSTPWINLPEFILHYLGGRRVAEYTNASHTQLLGVSNKAWLREIFEASGLHLESAQAVVQPGSDVGTVGTALASLPAFRGTKLIAPACHDTASAIAGIPASGDDWAFISSGTWSLVGGVLNAPCVSEAARRKNFSNEGGIGGKIHFLKNVSGMWLVRQCMEHWQRQGKSWTVEKLIEACATLSAPEFLLDVDDPELLPPGDMPARINAQLARANQAPILDEPIMANLIFHSLASRYAAILRDLAGITGKKLRRLYIVGGGSRNVLLNRLTEKATGLEVLIGSTESTTMGNFAIQLASLEAKSSSNAGVSSTAVAGWAGILAKAPIESSVESPAKHRS